MGSFYSHTSMCQQSLIQELCTWSEVWRDVCIREVINFNTHVGDVHSLVEAFACVDTCTVASIQDVSDAKTLQTGFVDGN